MSLNGAEETADRQQAPLRWQQGRSVPGLRGLPSKTWLEAGQRITSRG